MANAANPTPAGNSVSLQHIEHLVTEGQVRMSDDASAHTIELSLRSDRCHANDMFGLTHGQCQRLGLTLFLSQATVSTRVRDAAASPATPASPDVGTHTTSRIFTARRSTAVCDFGPSPAPPNPVSDPVNGRWRCASMVDLRSEPSHCLY